MAAPPATRGNSKDLVRATKMVPCFLARYAAAGGDVAALTGAFGLPARIELATDLKLPVRRFRALTERIAADIGDPHVGVTTALTAPRGAYGLLEYLARNMTSLGEGLSAFVHYSMRRGQQIEYLLEESGSETRYQFHLPGEPLCLGRHGNEFSLLMVLRLARELSERPDLAPTRVWFSHPAPPDSAPVARAFGVLPVFGSANNGLAFPASLMRLRVPSPDPALRSIIDHELDARLPTAPQSGDWVGRVAQRVRAALEDQTDPTTERIAHGLQVGPRTLQRRLAEAGTSFADVLDRVRGELAAEYLADPTRELKQIAEALGYSDTSAFARAFKRWTGKAPGDVRAQSRR